MSKFMHLSFLLFSVAVSLGNAVTQTDWSGGPSPYWPGLSWENEFNTSENIDYSGSPGELSLPFSIEDHLVIDFERPNFIRSMDVDQDGDMDILIAAGARDVIAWLDNEGMGVTWTDRIVSSSFYGAMGVYSEDIDGDGNYDILGAASFGNTIAWWSNYDGSGYFWVKHNIDTNFGGASSVCAADIDEDGDMDVVGTGTVINQVAWWENMNGSGTSWLKHTIDDYFNGARSVCVRDVDSDGDIDVVAAAFYSGEIAWWSNEGSGYSWQKVIVENDFENVACVCTDDVDGDGDIDVLGAAETADEIAWWDNIDGTGTVWTKKLIAGEMNGAYSVSSIDIDSDGDIDVIGAANYDGKIFLWENENGSGTSWVEHLIASNYHSSISVFSADLNSDGFYDILGSSETGDSVNWWDYIGYPESGSLVSSCLYLENDPGWGSIDWVSEEPEGTSLLFQVRSCDSPDTFAMGAWSDTLSSPCSLTGILGEGDSFMQYKALLGTSDSFISPSLDEITVSWNPVVVSDQNEPLSSTISLLPFVPNPSVTAMVKFTLPESATVKILIYDIAGRLINDSTLDNCAGGIHEIPLQGLAPGIYFCKLSAGDYLGIQSFVIIE